MATNLKIEDLPPEILSHIVSFLPAPSLAAACCVCRAFRAACAVESVWQARCQTDYNIKPTDVKKDANIFDVYTKILHPYGFMLGLWQADMGPYGGLVRIKFEGDRLTGTQYRPPVDPRVRDPLRCQEIITVEQGPDGSTDVLCLRGHKGKHHCLVEQRESDLFFKCGDPACHKHPNGEQHAFSKWLVDETNNNLESFLFQGQELLLMKFRTMAIHEKQTIFTPLDFPASRSDVPIQPGLFKGTYGSHGIELLMVTYNEDNTFMNAVKITGDPNVPATKTSIKADLKRPMILTLKQQDSIDTLSDIDIPDLPPDTKISQMPSQPFRVPMGCLDRHQSPPDRCKSRFHSQGHIAGHGFTTPTFIPGHWIIFDENTFGHIWLELRSFSLFSRVAEDV